MITFKEKEIMEKSTTIAAKKLEKKAEEVTEQDREPYLLDAKKQIFAKIIGKNLKKYREKRGFTLRELSAQSGYTTGYIELLEQGRSIQNTFVLQQLCEILFVSIKDLYNEFDEIAYSNILINENNKYLEFIMKIMAHNVDIKVLDNFINKLIKTGESIEKSLESIPKIMEFENHKINILKEWRNSQEK